MSATPPHCKPGDRPDFGGSFAWGDPLRIEDELEPEEKMIRDAARIYAQERLQRRPDCRHFFRGLGGGCG